MIIGPIFISIDERVYTKNFNKYKRNSDEKYVTAHSEIISPKITAHRSCCLGICEEKMNPFNRQPIFDKFWKLRNFKKQSNSNWIWFNIRKCDALIYENIFLDTFNILKGRLVRALQKDVSAEDLRGKYENSRRKIEKFSKIDVKEFICLY